MDTGNPNRHSASFVSVLAASALAVLLLAFAASSKPPPAPRATSKPIPSTLPPITVFGHRSYWRKALKDYRRQQRWRERIRLPGGGEIDHLGNTCFAVPGEIPGNGPFGNGHIPASRFAHEVSCPGATQHSFGADFLEQLRKRGYSGHPAGG